MRPRGGPRLPNVNVYVVDTADDLPAVLDQFVLYNIRYGTTGLYYSPDGVTLVRLVDSVLPSFPAVVQGDSLYGSAPGIISALPKDVNATRYWANTGTDNNPKWDQVNLADGVTGDLGVAHLDGGTGADATTFWRGDGSWAVPPATPYPPVFAGAGDDGLVPDPGTENGYFLRDDGTWQPISAGGTAFGGWVDAAAASDNLPAGWSSSNIGTGHVRVTHNLGLSPVTALAVSANPDLGGSTDDRFCNIITATADYFDVGIVDQGSGAVDEAVFFTAVLV